MGLTILNVAYPFAPVRSGTAGGAEQVVFQIDAALVRNGMNSVVLACEGSQVSGELISANSIKGSVGDLLEHHVWARQKRLISQLLRTVRVDVVHMHGIDFYRYLPDEGVPVLVTLHLPLSWYPPDIFHLERPLTHLVCVSEAQRRSCPVPDLDLDVIENGVPYEALQANHGRRRFALSLGRICWEKGYHRAIDAAKMADVPYLLAGEIYPYDFHQAYFREQVQPRLDSLRRYIGPVDFDRKKRLLTAARCLLVPSQAPETSSLVAMEAMACGTPVIAFPSGALSSLIEHERTGFIVENEQEMADAIRWAHLIDPEVCRATAACRFSVQNMTRQYVKRYESLARVSVMEPFAPPLRKMELDANGI